MVLYLPHDSGGDELRRMSGEWTEDYMRWKVETLALQHSHKEGQQSTGLWAEYQAGGGPGRQDSNEYVIELSQGWR